MKKALQISLAQTLFAIEEDAYTKLDTYLKNVRAHFETTEGKDEIIADIEGRIAEQFLETKRAVVTIIDVDAVIASMGHTEDFGGEPRPAHDAPAMPPRPRKLYRNPDDKVIAGVCSGIAAYLGVDVVWVRLAFVLFTLGTGFGIILYIVLWLLVPEAATPSQKLEMTGTPVTIETISENVKEKIEVVKEKHGSDFRRIISIPIDLLSGFFRFLFGKFFPFIGVLIGVIVATGAFVGAIVLSCMAVLILTSPLDQYADFPITDVATQGVVIMTVIGGYLAAVIPVIFLFLFAASLVARRGLIKPMLGFGLIGIWAVGLVIAGVAAFKGNMAYQDYVARTPAYAEVTNAIPFEGDVTALKIVAGNSVTLVQGDQPGLIATGREKDMDSVVVDVTDGTMTVRSKPALRNFCIFCDRRTPKLTLTLPSLATISASSGSRIVSEAWASEELMVVDLSSGSRGDMTLTASRLEAKASSGSLLVLQGAVTNAELAASSGSRIDTEDATITDAIAIASSGSRIRFGAIENLTATASSGSEITYFGNPNVDMHTDSGSDVYRGADFRLAPPLPPDAPDEDVGATE